MPYPVPSLMIPDSVLQDHNFKHLKSGGMHEFRLGDKVTYVLRQNMDTFTWLLSQVWHKFIPLSPEVLFWLDGSCNSI